MLFPAISRFRRRHGRSPRKGPPTPLTLVSAAYTPSPARLVLVFDRAIDIGAMNGSAVFVEDGVFNSTRYDGTGGATLLNPQTVRLTLVPNGEPIEPMVLMLATGSNGIVALDDRGTWVGTDFVELPFP